jgi:hypothetical protein
LIEAKRHVLEQPQLDRGIERILERSSRPAPSTRDLREDILAQNTVRSDRVRQADCPCAVYGPLMARVGSALPSASGEPKHRPFALTRDRDPTVRLPRPLLLKHCNNRNIPFEIWGRFPAAEGIPSAPQTTDIRP